MHSRFLIFIFLSAITCTAGNITGRLQGSLKGENTWLLVPVYFTGLSRLR